MSTASTSPSLGARRNKTLKPIPRLPPSAFSPPNSGTGERFPLPPSPGTVHPASVYDASATISSIDALQSYSSALGANLSTRLSGVVLSVPQQGVQNIEQLISSSKAPVLAVSVPLSDSKPSVPANVKVVVNTTFTQSTPALVDAVKSALPNGVVEIDVRSDLATEAGWEALEEFLATVLVDRDPEAAKPTIVLSNILPPSNGLELPTVTLLNHPSYSAFQGHAAVVSLNESVCIRFSPPEWGRAAPSAEGDDGVTAKEWIKRIKMYLGPIIEAFGFSRIIFASSSSSAAEHPSAPENWYELAREAVAELGIDQEGVDAIFGGNAQSVYSTN